MQTLKYAGLIECGASILGLGENQIGFDGFHLKKVLVKENSDDKLAREFFPSAELVQDTDSIIKDDSIELVIVSGAGNSNLTLVAEAIGAGKQVRVL